MTKTPTQLVYRQRLHRLRCQQAQTARDNEVLTARSIMAAFPELTRDQAMREACRIVARDERKALVT